jgi:hypothetical protein
MDGRREGWLEGRMELWREGLNYGGKERGLGGWICGRRE